MKTVRVISWIAVVIWMGLIFYMSAQVATESNELSIGITDKIITGIEKMLPGVRIDPYRMNHYIRKSAHFCTYMILGLLVSNAYVPGKVKNSKAYLISLAICVLYATSDEIHQLFVPGRGGQVKDVLLDSFGSLTGVGIYVLLTRWIGKKRNKE